MKYLYLLALTLVAIHSRAQLQYDPTQLRIPGRSFSIGITQQTGSGPVTQTKGFLKGKIGWSKFRLEVEGGSASSGKIKLAKSSDYKKGDSVAVSVYTRKWLLGGKGKLLFTQKIPYNYEDSISILTSGNIGRAPGDHVQFGVRTWFDNKLFLDQWSSAKKKLKNFQFDFDGGHLSKSKGDLKIEDDPGKIRNDRIKLIAKLAKDTAIQDTLQVMLDYIANYQCKIQSNGNGHALTVAADLYFDPLINAKLLKVKVVDSVAHKTYRYRINTNGGSITISSKGADGMDGRNGFDGLAGTNGADGTTSVDVQTTTAPDGTVQTTTTMTQGPGSDGGRGGDGENGEDGGNGGDGGNIVVNYTPAVTPYAGMIKAISVPGKGGSGGRGGDGGSGGSGGNGNPSGNSGLKGSDGRNGFDGSNGRSGKVSYLVFSSR